MRRWGAGLSALLVFAGLLYLMLPRPTDLAEAEVRSADVDQAVTLLKHQYQVRTHDAVLDEQMVTAYERADRPREALQLLGRIADQRALTREQRAQVRRMALADARPIKAFQILSGPKQPRGADELSELVSLAIATHHPAEALDDEQALARLRPHSQRVLTRLVSLAGQQGKYTIARDAQAHLLALDATPEQLQTLIQLDTRLNDPLSALNSLVQYAPPHDPKSLTQAYHLAIWSKQPERAVPYMWALYRQAPTLSLGKLLANALIAGHDPRAPDFLADLFSANPHDAQVRELYLSHLALAGRVDEALAVLRHAVDAAPDAAELHARIVSFTLGHNRHDAAIAELERWTKRHPGDRNAWHQLAVVHVWDSHSKLAWDVYAHLFASGGSELAWREAWLKISQAIDDSTPAGLANLKALLAAQPHNVALTRRLASAELEVNEPAAALATQAALVSLPGANRDDVVNLARWSLWYGRYEQGFTILEQAETRAPLPAVVLNEAVGYAARTRRFGHAVWFLQRLTAREPKNVGNWENLANVDESIGDLPAATRALTHRFAIDPAQAPRRAALLSLLLRQRREAEALDQILAWHTVASADEWRLGADLAGRLARVRDERRCLEAWVHAAPGSAEALVGLAGFEQSLGDAQATAHFRAAAALAPNAPDLLTRVASVLLYGHSPDSAAPYVGRLEKLPALGPESQRVIADFEATRHPVRAAAALDALHAHGGGDASSHFQRGQLALTLDQPTIARTEFERTVTLGRQARDEQSGEASAYALERLGRDQEAHGLWQQLAATHPASVTPWVALAQQDLASHDLAGAHQALLKARAIAPSQSDVQSTWADWLKASARPLEAAGVYATLRTEEPANPYWSAAESQARFTANQYGQASNIARSALGAAPGNSDLMEAYRQARDKGASQTRFTALTEGYSGFDRQLFGVGATARLSDRARLGIDLDQLDWVGGAVQVQQLALGLSGEQGNLDGALDLQVQRQVAGAPLDGMPLGDLKFGVHSDNSALSLTLAETRWQDTNALLAAGGREHGVSLAGNWQPDPRVNVRGAASVGALTVPGQPTGSAASGLAEIDLHPDAASPWGLYYQWNYHTWGSLGTTNGLPDHLMSHDLSLGYARRFGPLMLDLQPGLALDSTASQLTPTLNGDLALDVTPDAALDLQVGWSSRSLVIGQTGAYDLIQLGGHWWF